MKLLKTSVCCGLLFSTLTLGLTGCGTAPKTEEARAELDNDATKALNLMKSEDSGLQNFLNDAYGYVIFPDVGQGALGIGGAHGRGDVYQGGTMVGYADMTQINIGLQAGGQEFAELIVFQSKDAFDKFTNNTLTFEAAASAVILKSGAATAAKYTNGVAVFKKPKAGAMFEAAVGGQRFTYKAKSAT